MLDLWVVRSVCMLTRRAYKLGDLPIPKRDRAARESRKKKPRLRRCVLSVKEYDLNLSAVLAVSVSRVDQSFENGQMGYTLH